MTHWDDMTAGWRCALVLGYAAAMFGSVAGVGLMVWVCACATPKSQLVKREGEKHAD